MRAGRTLPEDGCAHHRLVGSALIGFSGVGLTLGLLMTANGFVGKGFIDGHGALGVGAVTLLVGVWLRMEGRSAAA
jgi:hypothetical protein